MAALSARKGGFLYYGLTRPIQLDIITLELITV